MEQIQSFVSELSTLVGVQAAFIFDGQGTIRLRSKVLELDEDRAVALARLLSRTLTGLANVQRSNQIDLDLVFKEGRLVVKGIDNGGLCILCNRQMNYSLLQLSLEQGLKLLRRSGPKDTGEPVPNTLEILKEIAQEILGDHAQKVKSIFEAAEANREGFLAAITQAEKLTRMFIDKDQAGNMAQRMRDVVEKSS